MKNLIKISVLYLLAITHLGCDNKNEFGSPIDDNGVPLEISEREKQLVADYVFKELYKQYQIYENNEVNYLQGNYGTNKSKNRYLIQELFKFKPSGLTFVDYMHSDSLGFFLLGVQRNNNETYEGLVVSLSIDINNNYEIENVTNVVLDKLHPKKMIFEIDGQSFKAMYNNKFNSNVDGVIGETMPPLSYLDEAQTEGMYFLRARIYNEEKKEYEKIRYFRIVLKSTNFYKNMWELLEFSEITEQTYSDAFVSPT